MRNPSSDREADRDGVGDEDEPEHHPDDAIEGSDIPRHEAPPAFEATELAGR